MTFLHHLNGTLGYGAIGFLFLFAVALHFMARPTWSLVAWGVAVGALAAAFVGQREITASVQHQLDEQKTAYSQLETRQAELNLRLTNEADKARMDADVLTNLAFDSIAKSDAKHQTELAHAKAENRRLRDRADVDVRMRGAQPPEAAGHPGNGGDSPPSAPAGGSHEGAPLTGDARRLYFDHREAVIEDEASLKTLQDYAQTCYDTLQKANAQK